MQRFRETQNLGPVLLQKISRSRVRVDSAGPVAGLLRGALRFLERFPRWLNQSRRNEDEQVFPLRARRFGSKQAPQERQIS